MAQPGRPLAFFALLEPDLGRRVVERVRHLNLRKGQTVIEHGSRSSDVYFLIDGEARVLLYSPDGREVSVRTLKAGQMFGELAAIDGLPRSATVVAVVPSVVAAMTRADFNRCIETSPKAAVWLAQQFAMQIRALTDKIFELSALNVRSRLHCELLRLATQAVMASNRAVLPPALTHHELANRIGTHREAVTRELRALAKKGIVVQKRRTLAINDVAALADLVRHSSGEVVQIFPAERFADRMHPLGAGDSLL
jgi:CRP/FNR family transcriptional regulator, cyclic AMP receptor protein